MAGMAQVGMKKLRAGPPAASRPDAPLLMREAARVAGRIWLTPENVVFSFSLQLLMREAARVACRIWLTPENVVFSFSLHDLSARGRMAGEARLAAGEIVIGAVLTRRALSGGALRGAQSWIFPVPG